MKRLARAPDFELTEPTDRDGLMLLVGPLLALLRRHRRSTLIALVALSLGATASARTLIGDCNGDGCVRVNELVTGVTISLGEEPVTMCEALDCNGSLGVHIDCMIAAVNNALTFCGPPTPNPLD